MRKIIHIDMDAFFAAVEMRDNPSLKNLPVAVAKDEPRGVISTANYEARRYGVRSALSVTKAKRLCPRLVLVPPRFSAYKKVSQQLHEIFSRYTSIIEPLSLDEAYLDVTNNTSGKTATQIAKEIKAAIKSELNLTASAGVSYNKFLAKIASDLQKPDGLSRILPKDAERFLEQLRIEAFYGVGPATAKHMHDLGIFTGKDLKARSREFLEEHFGKMGDWLYGVVRGEDSREVQSSRERKSIGVETTFEKDLFGITDCSEPLPALSRELFLRMEKAGFSGFSLVLKIKFSDFSQITRSRTLHSTFSREQQILNTAQGLLSEHLPPRQPVRLIGLTITNPSPTGKTNKIPHKEDPTQLQLPLKI